MTDDFVHFEQDTHSYIDAGVRIPSTTQAIKLAGLISYDHIHPAVLEKAKLRGDYVHRLTAEWDEGKSDVLLAASPAAYMPYLNAYVAFLGESGFIVDADQVERPQIASIGAWRVGMTPDRIGWLHGIPTILEIKCTSAKHPAWGVQLAGYEAGAERPAGVRHYQRVAVQLFPTGKYKLHSYDDPSDFTTFCSAFAVAAFKLKHRLATLD